MTMCGTYCVFKANKCHTLSGGCGTCFELAPARANRTNTPLDAPIKITSIAMCGGCGAFLHYDLSARMHTQEAFIQKSRHMRHTRHPAVTR